MNKLLIFLHVNSSVSPRFNLNGVLCTFTIIIIIITNCTVKRERERKRETSKEGIATFMQPYFFRMNLNY